MGILAIRARMKEINQILEFIVEIEKLKGVLRKSRPVGLQRYENSGEHSWHVCVSAMMLQSYANEAVDINRVIKMLLIHDLGEIDAGDKIVYQSETESHKSIEKMGIQRLLEILPSGMGREFLALWEEFEAGVSMDAKFAKAIDRVPPLLQNIHDDGHGWKKNGIVKEQVFALNSDRISAGSTLLWDAIEKQLQKAAESGALV